MTVDELLQVLQLPESTRVQQRVPKKLLIEHGAATPQDKRLIQDGVDEITWLASLKPHLTGVPAYEDEHRHYREAAVLSLTLRPGTRPTRLVELLHRAVPHPVLLATTVDQAISLSVAHLRKSQTEADQTVLDGPLLSVAMPADGGDATFRAALSLAGQPRSDLYALVQGWMDTLAALDVAQETGTFLREAIAARLRALGLSCEEAPAGLAASDPRNVCNRGRSGAGVQLELSLELRRSPRRALLIRTVREALLPIPNAIDKVDIGDKGG